MLVFGFLLLQLADKRVHSHISFQMVSSCVFNPPPMSPHSIQRNMPSRTITIIPFGLSTRLDYPGNLLVLIPIILFFMSLKRLKLIFTTWVFFLVLSYQGWACTALSFPHTPESCPRRTGSLASAPLLTSAAALRATTSTPITMPIHLHTRKQADSLKRRVREWHEE